jgi:hypothetical protein
VPFDSWRVEASAVAWESSPVLILGLTTSKALDVRKSAVGRSGSSPASNVVKPFGLEAEEIEATEQGPGNWRDARSNPGQYIHRYMPMPIPMPPLSPLQSSVAEGQQARMLLLAFIVTVAEKFISWPPLAPSVPVQYPQAKPGSATASRLTTTPASKLSEAL